MFPTDLRPLDAVPQGTIVTRPTAAFQSQLPTNAYLQRQPIVIIAQNILLYSDGCSATQLLTSCRQFMQDFVDKDGLQNKKLYELLLRRDFPTVYRSLAAMVSARPAPQRGLLWCRLYHQSHVLSRDSNQKPQVLRGHTEEVTCITRLANNRIASGSWDNTVRIWPLNGASIILKGHIGMVTCLAQLADGRVASGSDDWTVRIWSLNGSSTVLRGHTNTINCLTRLADGCIASGSADDTVRIWRWPLNNSAPTVLTGHTGVLRRVAQLFGCINGVTCLTQLADGRIAAGSDDHTVRIWPWPLHDSAPTDPTVLKGHTGPVTCLTQLADGRIASGSDDHTVRIWFQPRDGSRTAVFALRGHTGPVTCLTRITNRHIASGSDDHTVRVWRLNVAAPPTGFVLRGGNTGPVICLTRLTDGRIASGSDDHTVRVWGKSALALFQRALKPVVVRRKQVSCSSLEDKYNSEPKKN